jgi:hypothetical protein
VGAQLGALAGVETALEQGAEDRGLDERPVEPADLEQGGDLGAREREDVAGVEQAAVEPVDLFRAEQAAVGGHLREQLAQGPGEDVGATLRGLAQALEDAPGQQARVLGEQAEQDPVQEVGDALGVLAAGPEALGDLGEVAGGLLGDLGGLQSWAQLLGRREGIAQRLEGL